MKESSSPALMMAWAKFQVQAILALSLQNRRRMLEIIKQERIDCDLSQAGSVYLANNSDAERGVFADVAQLSTYGSKAWSGNQVRQQLAPEFDTGFWARFVPGDGSYHPVKYLTALLVAALKRGVQLLTNMRVHQLVRLTNDWWAVGLNDQLDVGKVGGDGDGPLRQRWVMTRSVVVATNAWTGLLLPQLAPAILPMMSQLMVTLNMPIDRTRGRTVTSGLGPVFFHQHPVNKQTALVMGGGIDRECRSSDLLNPPIDKQVHELLLQLRSQFYPEAAHLPIHQEWSGTMAFTKDQLPAIGMLQPGLIVAVAFNGYGGSYTTAAGEIAALMATHQPLPSWFHRATFSPRRLLLPGFQFTSFSGSMPDAKAVVV